MRGYYTQPYQIENAKKLGGIVLFHFSLGPNSQPESCGDGTVKTVYGTDGSRTHFLFALYSEGLRISIKSFRRQTSILSKTPCPKYYKKYANALAQYFQDRCTPYLPKALTYNNPESTITYYGPD